MESSIKSTKAHCKFCFDVLVSHLNKTPLPAFPKEIPNAKVPIFVTWKIKDDLRGCIGTFQPQYLQSILPKYTLISALKDSRFTPITKSQLPNLHVGVSLLINFQKNKTAYDWQVGKHGIIIQLEEDQRQYSATFLPQVASEQNWDQKTTLQHLLRKSGYYGKLETAQKLIKLTTYESSKQYLTYEDYVKMKSS